MSFNTKKLQEGDRDNIEMAITKQIINNRVKKYNQIKVNIKV